MELDNLTEFEQRAIDAVINLSDGHPRQTLTNTQASVIDRLPQLFKEAADTSLADLESACKRSFFDAIHQHSAPWSEGRVFSVYSSSVATVAVGFALAESNETVALLHPTFDNIHDLLARLVDIIELTDPVDPASAVSDAVGRGATAIFLTTPNNPTGHYIDEPGLRQIVNDCAKENVTLCLDTSFRGFDTRTQFDHYAILESTGIKYIVIEDTGKLWPVSEMKLGFVVVSSHWRRRVEHALSDILLSVSPLVLALVRDLAADATEGGFDVMRQLIDGNRTALLDCVRKLPGVRVLNADARVSVARIRFPDSRAAMHVLEALRTRGVHLLPCGQFHWNAQHEGASTLRVALSRDHSMIKHACDQLTEVWRDYLQGQR